MSRQDFVKAVTESLNKLYEFFDGIKYEDHFERDDDSTRKLIVYYTFCLRAIKEKLGEPDNTADNMQVSSSVLFKMAMALLQLRDLVERITEELEDSEGILENVMLIMEDSLLAFEDLDPFGLKHIPDPTDDEMEVEQPIEKKRKLN